MKILVSLMTDSLVSDLDALQAILRVQDREVWSIPIRGFRCICGTKIFWIGNFPSERRIHVFVDGGIASKIYSDSAGVP